MDQPGAQESQSEPLPENWIFLVATVFAIIAM